MKNKWIAILIALFTLGACSDIFEAAPQDKISENDVWNNETLVRLYINACYSSAFEQGLFRNTQIGHATDELHSIKGSVYYYYITQGILTADNVGNLNNYMNNWEDAYATIRDINIFFSKIESVPMADSDKDEMKGEMTFIQAFLYSQLISRYGGVPLIKDLFELNDEYSIPRDSYDDCVAFIVEEIDKSIGWLPARQEGDKQGRVSADAARALKARVLLYAASPLNNPSNDMAKWQEAADAAQVLIGDYELHNDYQQLFLEHSGEVIFARYFTQAYEMELSKQVGRNGDNGWGSDSPTQNLVSNYEMSNGQFPYLPDGSVNTSSGFDPANPYENRDPRFNASILHDGSMWMGRETETFVGGMDSRTGPIASWNGSKTSYFLKKFVPEDIPPIGSTVYPTPPWIMFRYAEILLNYAEAKFMLGDEDEVRKYVNMVRARSGVDMPSITETGDDLKQRIRHERRIEFVFEGHRYFDVRRWKIANETETKDIIGVNIEKETDGAKTYSLKTLITRTWDDKFYLLPIPRVEIDRSLNSLEQNPGYN
ncbi:MAG: RagB/SusD family nutrient uptake outer membrane protein [Bacteroidales bacterium]|nr:MAG: RagB/SusD family nutrient uptake outer membrane protein [Bacteroidales bacterium]